MYNYFIAPSVRPVDIDGPAPWGCKAPNVLTAVLAAMTFICAGHADAGPLEDATTAFKQGDYSTALSLWRPLAEQGNAVAETGLGTLYEMGRAVPKDEAQAVALYRKAAEQGDAEAEYRLGERYVAGFGLPHESGHGNGSIPVDKNGALYWYRKAAQHQHEGELNLMAESDVARVESAIKRDSAKGNP